MVIAMVTPMVSDSEGAPLMPDDHMRLLRYRQTSSDPTVPSDDDERS